MGKSIVICAGRVSIKFRLGNEPDEHVVFDDIAGMAGLAAG
jgi:hypothetical protein